MSLWQRLRASLRGPMRLEDGGDPEVEADIDEEMPDAAEDAKEAEEEESVPTLGAVTLGGPQVTPDPTIQPPATVAFEGAEAEASEDAEASGHAS